MAARGHAPALITSARKPRSLDTEERTKRYLLTMAARVAFFLVGCFLPAPWNWVMFILAAVLPGIAVILANAIDNRSEASVTDAAQTDRPALEPGVVVPGDVEDAAEGGVRERGEEPRKEGTR